MITGIVHMNVICSDLEKSWEFYVDKLGGIPDRDKKAALEPRPLPLESAKVMGFKEPAQLVACFIRFGKGEDVTAIDLEHFIKPVTIGKPYDRLNHVGITRICLRVDDVDRMYKELKAKGVEFISPPADEELPTRGLVRCCNCKDPDGIVITFSQLIRERK